MRTACLCPCWYNGWKDTVASEGIKICSHCDGVRRALPPRKLKGNRDQRRTSRR